MDSAIFESPQLAPISVGGAIHSPTMRSCELRPLSLGAGQVSPRTAPSKSSEENTIKISPTSATTCGIVERSNSDEKSAPKTSNALFPELFEDVLGGAYMYCSGTAKVVFKKDTADSPNELQIKESKFIKLDNVDQVTLVSGDSSCVYTKKKAPDASEKSGECEPPSPAGDSSLGVRGAGHADSVYAAFMRVVRRFFS